MGKRGMLVFLLHVIVAVYSIRMWDWRSCAVMKERRLLCRYEDGVHQYAIVGDYAMVYIDRVPEKIELQTIQAPQLLMITVKTGNLQSTCDRMIVDRTRVKVSVRGMECPVSVVQYYP